MSIIHEGRVLYRGPIKTDSAADIKRLIEEKLGSFEHYALSTDGPSVIPEVPKYVLSPKGPGIGPEDCFVVKTDIKCGEDGLTATLTAVEFY